MATGMIAATASVRQTMRFRHAVENCALMVRRPSSARRRSGSPTHRRRNTAPGCLPLTLMPPPAGDRPDLADQRGAQGGMAGTYRYGLTPTDRRTSTSARNLPVKARTGSRPFQARAHAQKCRRQRGLGLVMQTSKFERRRTIQRCELIVRGATQRFRRRLSKQRTISDRQAPEFPEAVIGSNPCDSCRR